MKGKWRKLKGWEVEILGLVVQKNENETSTARKWFIPNNNPENKSSIVGLQIRPRDQGDVMNVVRWDILGGSAQNFNVLHASHLNGSFNRQIHESKERNLKGKETLDKGSLEGSQSKHNKGDFMQ